MMALFRLKATDAHPVLVFFQKEKDPLTCQLPSAFPWSILIYQERPRLDTYGVVIELG